MFDSLSAEMQLVLVIIAIAVLCLLVFANNRRNKRKQYDRKNRDFRKNYYEKKKGQKNKER